MPTGELGFGLSIFVLPDTPIDEPPDPEPDPTPGDTFFLLVDGGGDHVVVSPGNPIVTQ